MRLLLILLSIIFITCDDPPPDQVFIYMNCLRQPAATFTDENGDEYYVDCPSFTCTQPIKYEDSFVFFFFIR